MKATARYRSAFERDANAIDADLYRVILRMEALIDTLPRGSRKEEMSVAITKLRQARTPVRLLMHVEDRKETM